MEPAPLYPATEIPQNVAAFTPVAERLTRLVADIFHTPIAALTLLPAMIQWVSCAPGFATPPLLPLPATLLPTAHAGGGVVIADLHQHRRSIHHPMVAQPPHLRFYAEVPLSDPAGHVLGVLWIADDLPRTLPPAACAQLRTFADWALVELITRAPAWHPQQQATVLASHLGPALRAQALRTAYGVGMVVQDAAGQICASDPHAAQILGLTTSQINGRTSLDPRWHAIHLDGAPFPGTEHPAMVALRTGQAQSARMGIHTSLGRIIWLAVQSQPLVHAGATAPAAVISSFLDITHQQQQILLRERLGQDGESHGAADIQDAQQAQHPYTVFHVQFSPAAVAAAAATVTAVLAQLRTPWPQIIRTTDLVAPLDATQLLIVLPQTDEAMATQHRDRLQQLLDGAHAHPAVTAAVTMTIVRPAWR